MKSDKARTILRVLMLGTAIAALSACENNGSFDGDLRHFGKNIFDTSDAAQQATAARPVADARGIISYPGYQVAIARQGDTVESVAARVGLTPAELGNYNAIPPGTVLRQNEVLALPRRVAEASGAAALPGTLPATTTGGQIDVSTIASGAIDRSATTSAAGIAPAPVAALPAPTGTEPARHKVERGETAYSVARLYNVNVRALADWNGLGNDLNVREGQILLIPVSSGKAAATAPVTAPGEGSPTPTPPSATKPLPDESPAIASEPVKTPPAPDLGVTQTASYSFPVKGKIIRGYDGVKNKGIDIAVAAGTAVTASGDGTVAAITTDIKGMTVLIIRHADKLMTVYARIDGITVAKGDKVKRGQTIAKVSAADPVALHFEIRQGAGNAVDPMPFLQ